MSRRQYSYDLTAAHKLIVGEGESDRNFLAEFCAVNGIVGFEYAFTGIHFEKYNPSGFSAFERYLPILEGLAGFPALTDLVLVCDSAQNANTQITSLQTQIRRANAKIGRNVFDDNLVANVISQSQSRPRVHALVIPHNAQGGIESICFDVARDKQNSDNAGLGTQIEGWVNTFAGNAAPSPAWTIEKRDKLRLQAFISAAWKSKPDLHFSQLFDMTGNQLIPLTSATFDPIRNFLRAVEGL